MAGLQSGEGRMMIDSVVWAQYINATDRHTDSDVAIARDTLYVGGKQQTKLYDKFTSNYAEFCSLCCLFHLLSATD